MNRTFTRIALAMALFAGTTAASAQQTLVVDGTKSYAQELVQGEDYILPGTDGSWYAQPEFFTHKTGDVWTFNAYQFAEYDYTIKLDEDLKYIDVDEIVGEPSEENVKSATWAAGITAALWVNGSYGLGFPRFGKENGGLGWTEHDGWSGANSVPFAQIDYLKYRMTLILGEQLDPTSINFKFFMGNRWGGDVTKTFAQLEENPYFYMSETSDDNGNFFPQADAIFSDGDTLIINLDMTAGEGNGKFTIDYRKYVPTDFPTLNGVNMQLSGSFWYATAELTQGQEFTIANEQVVGMDLATTYVDPIAATSLGGGKYKFNGVSGTYTVALQPKLNYVKIFPGTMEAPATYDSAKALWIIGGDGIGQPSYAENSSSWGASLTNSIPVTQVAENVYKIRLTAGQELDPSSVNLKFFGQAGWGKEFTSLDVTMESDYLTLNAPEATVGYNDDGEEVIQHGGDDGNIWAGSTALGNGDVVTLTIDLNGYEAPYIDEATGDIVTKKGTITVEYEPYAGPMPTLNGEKMTSTGYGYSYVADLQAGSTVTIGGDVAEVIDLVKSDDFFYNYDYFTKTGDTSFKLNAVSGRYAIELDQNLKYFRIYPVQADGAAGNFTADGGWATWVCGNAGIGFPSYSTNKNNWGESNGWSQSLGISISPAQISEKIYRLTVTVGKQVTADATFKFYDSYNYTITDGRESDAAADFIDLLDENIVYNDNDLSFNGLEDGATYVVVIDRTGERSTIKAEKATDETGAGVELPSGIETISTDRQANGAYYNMQGVRVAAPVKGLYIHNGRKVVVK